MSPERRELITFWTDLALRLLIGLGIVWVLIQFTTYMHEATRQLQRSDVKHETLLREHQTMLGRLPSGR